MSFFREKVQKVIKREGFKNNQRSGNSFLLYLEIILYSRKFGPAPIIFNIFGLAIFLHVKSSA